MGEHFKFLPIASFKDTVLGTSQKCRREIRVLDLLPGTQGETVRCALRNVDLDGEEEYEALSYVWGKLVTEKYVYISQFRVPITRNLYSGLQRLRYETKIRTLWIDQLCINQADNEERASQVGMMRDIYRRCSRCVIWLGELDGDVNNFNVQDAEAVFDFIEFVSKAQPGCTVLPEIFHDSVKGESVRRAFEAFSMYGNPWWSRIWTIQEFIIPHSAIFIWGPFSLQRDILNLAGYRLQLDVMMEFFDAEFQLCRRQYRSLLRRLLYPTMGFVYSTIKDDTLDLLMRWRHRDASDPRDKVYALLGLLPPGVLQSAQCCSYDIPVANLFSQVTIDLIKEEGGLRPLIGSSDLAHITPSLPSWAIDFACSQRLGRRQLKWWNHSHRYKEFSANGTFGLSLQTSKMCDALLMRGVLVDEIYGVSEVYKVSETERITHSSTLKIIESARTLVDRSKMILALPATYITKQSWETAFWRTMVGDLIMDEYPVERAGPQHEYLFPELLLYLQGENARIDVDISDDIHFSNALHESVYGMVTDHAFFITKTGYIGFGPPDTRPGDQVWVLYGGQVPFILHKSKESKVPDGLSQFRLVGDAFVYGIMDGEAVQESHESHEIWLH
ncbi:heterokaryon incompatibility protein-domain-containing protein [Phaeosphaeriaceae sp. PMI808]|nr:heterokaryon incompatibility protein-domain-containing protein [Phaeosphaeriaceae sp. PMI808]